MYTVGLYTLGCKVSQYETEAIAEEFLRHGFRVLPFDEICDAYVINTCTVTAESDRKSRQMIRRATGRSRDAIVAVVGCYSQRDSQSILSIPGVSIVLGTDSKLSVVGKVKDMLDSHTRASFCSISDLSQALFEPMTVTRAPRTRAYVKIEDGCECRCTYCAIADARGRVRSKPRADVIDEVERLYAAGTREIVLTGIETGSYGKDFDCEYTLADLILELDRRHSCDRIRLGSLAPELVGHSFTEKIKNAGILAPHFHISMQSGSDRVLRMMRRRYTRESALRNIQWLREAIPQAGFTTDLMVGFPGETEEDFLMSCDFVREAGLLDAHVFAYSRRSGTAAALYDGQIDESVKHRRSKELISVVKEVRDSILDTITEQGEPLSVILEDMHDGMYTAHSASYVEMKVTAPDGMTGELVYAVPVSHKDGIVYGYLQK